MKREYIVERDFIECGFRCVVVGHSMGHRCGYLAIPQGHTLYGKDYDDIYVEVHGGLTYSNESDEYNYPVETDEKVWWIGFDCGHFGDGKDYKLVESLIFKIEDERERQRAIEHFKFMKELDKRYPDDSKVRTAEYVENELKNLAAQVQNIQAIKEVMVTK